MFLYFCYRTVKSTHHEIEKIIDSAINLPIQKLTEKIINSFINVSIHKMKIVNTFMDVLIHKLKNH